MGVKKLIQNAVKNIKEGVQAGNRLNSLQQIADFSEGADSLLALKDKSFSEVVLESLGIEIPLPTRTQALEFYIEYEELFGRVSKNENLGFINPEEWTEIQFIAYQSDVRKFQSKARLQTTIESTTTNLNESKAKKIRRAKKEVDDNKKRFDKLIELYNNFINDTNKNLAKDTPEDLKAKGIQSFPELFQVLQKQIAKLFFTALRTIFIESGLDQLDKKEQELREQLGIPNNADISPEDLQNAFCPTSETLDRVISQRNNMVDFLNKQQDRINNLKKPVEASGELVNFLLTTATAIKLTTFITNQAAKVIPLIPGAVVSIINDLDTIRETILVDNKNQPRLPPIQQAVSNVNIPLNQLNRLITQIVFALGDIDDLISLCRPDAELESLSPEVLSTVVVELSSELEGENLYKGFRLEIETRAYTDTVNQNRAVGKNQNGIILIQTNYSFASDPNVLIRELKFRIDAENLSTY
jgi:hypothetical protein